MNQRQSRHTPARVPVAPVHRGPQAVTQVHSSPFQHAPNAALLIDFDNVTMGIRSDLASELRNLLSSEIIKGKVAVQRAYADWRRYPQYIVPLAESSIDMIMAPAYGSSKKNATDIRLAVDAIELVFTRPEIGTYILLSGDSDFASLVTKLKEYGKYVIGVGIRESSSDLLVMNCDEYYSYNALAGLVKASDEEVVKWDPWELVVEAINRMVKNGDVMRSDRLKQVMQDIDPQFDEKNLGMSKFSRFCQEAASQGLIKVIKLENGQLEVAPAEGAPAAAPRGPAVPRATENGEREERGRRGRRGGRGRGAGRDRDGRNGRDTREVRLTTERPVPSTADEAAPASASVAPPTDSVPSAPPAPPSRSAEAESDGIGQGGERLTREEAFELVRRAAASLVSGDTAVPASAIRQRVFELLGRDSESLNERFFRMVLRDAHDADVIDLRRRGDDYEVSLPSDVGPVAEQLNRAAAARASAAPSAEPGPLARRGMGPRGIAGRGRPGARPMAPPPDLLAIGVVEVVPRLEAPADAAAPKAEPAEPKGRAATRKKRSKSAAATTKAAVASAETAAGDDAVKPRRPRGPRKKAATKAS
ncbi:MAG TPA: NYN domain-containing protein [Gemmatimonadaceae bacterium]|nr:NYN domain-containing protein [Gemmatimonadaceae bacterium]